MKTGQIAFGVLFVWILIQAGLNFIVYVNSSDNQYGPYLQRLISYMFAWDAVTVLIALIVVSIFLLEGRGQKKVAQSPSLKS